MKAGRINSPFLLAILSGILGAFIVASSYTTGSSVLTTKLALNWKAEPQFGGFYAANRQGHFEKQGLKVDILEGGAGTPVVQMVAAGKMPFGIASADEVVLSRARGGKVVALFAAYQTNPQGIMVHEGSGIQSLEKLFQSKQTLALQKGLPYAMFLLKKYEPSQLQIVPYLGGIGNFLNDKNFSQQCFVTSEPLEATRQGAKPKAFLIADEGYNPYTTVLITHEDLLTKDPDLCKRMVAAVRAGWTDYLKSPDLTNAEMGKINKAMSAQTFAESAAAQKRLIETAETQKNGLGSMSQQRWEQLIDQLHGMNLIREKMAARDLFRNL